MRLYARLRWAIFMLCAFVSVAGAQVTGPTTTIQQFAEVGGSNISGDMLSAWTLMNDRPDTLLPLVMSVSFRDTVADTTATIIDVSYIYGNGQKGAYRDTVRLWELQYFPSRNAGGEMPDSLFAVVLTNNLPAAGEKFELRINKVSADQGYTMVVPFASSQVKGTGADTSYAVYLGRGAMDLSLGFQATGDTAAVTYTAIYNSGYGWGMSVPADTLADSTFTWQSITNLRYIDVGELLAAPWVKIIRKGTREADTVTVREFIRVEPR